jgi:hypothetical protein
MLGHPAGQPGQGCFELFMIQESDEELADEFGVRLARRSRSSRVGVNMMRRR